MYIPAWFREDDPTVLHDLMRQYSFGALVTVAEGRPFATHLPFLLQAEDGGTGTLRAHMARANPQWRHFEAGGEALVIFQGPHTYISPSWYEVHPSVPTWNYAVVHAYGTPRLLDDDALYDVLRASVETYEAPSVQPWSMSALTEEFVQNKMRAVVGFEIAITRLEGKFKLSQNRSETDRERVIVMLESSGHPENRDVAAWMRRTGP